MVQAQVQRWFVLSVYVGWRVLKEDEKFEIVRGFGLALAAIGGTSFCGRRSDRSHLL